MLGPDLPRIQVWLQRWREKTVRATIEAFQLIKEEERRVFPKRSYFKLKEEYPKDILEFNSDEKIEVGRAGTTGTVSDKGLEFAEYLHEI